MQTINNDILTSVVGKQAIISKGGKRAIKEISGPRPLAFIKEICLTWLVIISVIGIALIADNIVVSLIAIFIVATRQLVFVFLIHEQSHHLAFNNRFGDLITNFFIAYPLLLMTVDDYAEVHLAHHRHFFTEKDPDHIRKSGINWKLPIKPKLLLRLFLTDICGLSVWRFYQGKRMAKKMRKKPVYKRRMQIPSWVKPAYLLGVVIIITWAQVWSVVLLYWLLPLATLFHVMVRWGALCEHIYNLPNAAVEESTPMIILSWWERLILPNLNFNYHLYHHYYPGVSFTQLPKVHQIYEGENLIKSEHIFYGYKSMLKYFLTAKHQS